MTRDEALKILEGQETRHVLDYSRKLQGAVQLGIEALKFFKILFDRRAGEPYFRLPSETEEEEVKGQHE